MQFIIKIVQLVVSNLKWVWNIAPILMLLEIWALIRVIVIVALVASVVFKGRFDEWFHNIF